MRVEILQVDHSSERPRVSFLSEFGRGWAYWSGAEPGPGETRDVEVSIGCPLTWGAEIQTVGRTEPRIEACDGAATIRATLDTAEDDGFTALRMGPSLIMLETMGHPPPIGTSVEAHVPSLTLSDTGI